MDKNQMRMFVFFTGFAFVLVSALSGVYFWARGLVSGIRLSKYMKLNHSGRWHQLTTPSPGELKTNVDYIFYLFSSAYEGDAHLQELKNTTRKWLNRFFFALGLLGISIATTILASVMFK